MNKFRKNSKNDYLKYGALALLLMLTLGYALLSANLNITGTSNFARTTWNIHFENLVPSTNMTLGNGEGASITQNKTTEVTYTLNFTEPGQYYEFLVDAKNDGTIDGMVNTVTSTKKLGSETAVPITTSPSNLPAYLEYSATYSDGTPIAQYHLLESGEKETYKVRIAFSTDIDATDLPGSDQTLELTFGVEYVQKDEHAVPVRIDADYATDSWDDIISSYNGGRTTKLQEALEEGTTREVPLDLNLDGESDATCNARIANLSTPAACSTEGFSQTACGLVLECANVVTTHNMNSTNTNAGGWPASSMRTYLNDETANTQSFYNALPSNLRSKIISTTVVSGHGSKSGETNFTSTDKIYLLSPMEVWGNNSYSQYDSARSLSRQLDYYENLGVNNTNYSGAIKKNSINNAYHWWLRAARSVATNLFDGVTGDGNYGDSSANYTGGVAPAFRIA